MNEPMESINRYAVEVSGWDNEENFFVEHTRLDWSEQNQKKVVLRHPVARGCVVFLRLLETVNPPANLPVAFRAGRIQPAAERDCSEVHLAQLWPEPRAIGSKRGEATEEPRAAAAQPRFLLESILRKSFATAPDPNHHAQSTRRQMPSNRR